MDPCTFVHIGDAHMGPNGRNDDRWAAMDQILAAAHSVPPGMWLIPGDLNHARMTISDRNRWADTLRAMANAAPVVLCYGNHDLPGDLDVFARLSAKYTIHVVSYPRMLSLHTAQGHKVTMFVLPYPTEAGLVSEGVPAGEMVASARRALDAIFLSASMDLEEARKRGDITLAIGHVNVAGSIVSTGQPNIGREIEIDAPLIGRLGPCYVGLNHIHKAQSIGGAHYPGSICRLDWGEVDAKGYIRATFGPVCHICGQPATCFGVYEDPEGSNTDYACNACCGHGNEDGWCKPISEGGVTDCPPRWHVATVPLDVAPMYHVEGQLTRDGFTYDVKGAEKPASWKGCEVRVRARYPQPEKAMLEMAKAHILAEFAEAARFELELQAVPDTALRAPAVAAAKTLAEKVQAWGTETHTTLPAALLDVLPALEHGDPDSVIAAERGIMGALLDPPAARVSEERAVVVA